MKQERDSLATTLNEIRHDTSRKMADMQQRFDHTYALMQDCQVRALASVACHHTAHSETQLEMYLHAVKHLVNGGLPCLSGYSFLYKFLVDAVACRCQPEEGHVPELDCCNFSECMQNNTQSSTRDECARVSAKIEILEQRQAAAAQQASDAAHTHSLQTKQLERSVEDHQQRLVTSVNKAESRGREAAEQIAQRAVADSQTSMQVCTTT